MLQINKRNYCENCSLKRRSIASEELLRPIHSRRRRKRNADGTQAERRRNANGTQTERKRNADASRAERKGLGKRTDYMHSMTLWSQLYI